MRTGGAEFEGNDRFEVLRRLGAGGMGVVFEARDRERQVRVAIKTLQHLDAQGLFRLKQEFRSLHDLQHPNLVRLGELVEHRGVWFFTMELVEGSDFLTHVRPGYRDMVSADTLLAVSPEQVVSQPSAAPGSLDEPRLRRSLAQLVAGLDAIHAAGKVHRDVKPSNLIVTDRGRVVVLDFGLVTESADSHTSTEAHAAGTAAYMAPEQAASRGVTPAADWYSVGVLLYEAITGRLPFTGTAMEIMLDKHRRPPEPPGKHARVPEDLEALCLALLASDPRARPGAPEVLQRIGVSAGEISLLAPPQTVPSAQSAVFVGRTAELAQLAAAYDRIRQEGAATVLVRGASGLGKSALLRHFAEAIVASEERAVVLSGRCYERASVPYKAFDGIVDALSSHLRRLSRVDAAQLVPMNAALLPRAFPVLGRVEEIATAPRRPASIGPHELRTRVFRALRELLARLAERVPLILVIDDLQWADAESLALMREVMSGPDVPALLLLLSARDGGAPLDLGIPAEVIELGPLGADDASALATALIQRAQVQGLASVAAITAEAAGHPLYIDELIRHASLTHDAGTPALRLDDAIWRRASRLGEEALHLLQLVCIAGAPLPERTILDAAELPPGEFDRQVSILRVAHLVRSGASDGATRLEPYHDRVRESVLQHLDEQRRAWLHGRLAAALRGSELGLLRPELLVRHLEGAGQPAEAALKALVAAGRAADALAFDQAAELYATALRLGTFDARTRVGVRADLAHTLATAGRCAEAADQYVELAAQAEQSQRLEYHRLAAENLLIAGYIDRGLAAVAEVLAVIGERMPASPRRALISLLWHRAKIRLRGTGWRARGEDEVPRADLIRQDAYKSISHGLGLVDNILARDFQARCLLLALETGEEIRIATALCYEACFLSSEGNRRVPRARALIERARELADKYDDDFLGAWVHSAQGFASYFDGSFAQAVAAHERAEALFIDAPTSKWWELDSSRLCRVFALRHLGHVGEIRRLHDAYARDAQRRGDRYMETTLTRYCSFLWLVADDPEGGERRLDEAEWMPPDRVFHLQHWFELEARAELALYRGEAAEAQEAFADRFRALERSLLLRAQIVRCIYHWLRARLAIGAASEHGSVRAAVKLVRKTVRRLDREDVGYATVWAALLRAGIAEAEGGRATARAAFERAERLARQQQMEMCAAAAQRRRGELTDAADDGDLAAADAWMAGEGVAVPAKLVEVYAPRLASPRALPSTRSR